MAKQIFVFGLIFTLFVLFCLRFVSKAETLNSIQTCSGEGCLTNISDVKVADSGEFFLLINSSDKPYVRKVDFSSNAFTDDITLPLDESNPDEGLFKVGISKDGEKAFAFRITNAATASSRIVSSSFNNSIFPKNEVNLKEQTNQGTDCRCPANTYFDGTLCVSGSTTCTDTTSDIVCSCDNLNFLNSCTAQANGVKKFTKTNCGSLSNLTCSNDD